jgi:hypothetical protein
MVGVLVCRLVMNKISLIERIGLRISAGPPYQENRRQRSNDAREIVSTKLRSKLQRTKLNGNGIHFGQRRQQDLRIMERDSEVLEAVEQRAAERVP